VTASVGHDHVIRKRVDILYFRGYYKFPGYFSGRRFSTSDEALAMQQE
jgi:hypothetical protein